MRHLAVCLSFIAGACAVLAAEPRQGAKPAALRACQLLTKEIALKVTASVNKRIFDILPPDEELLGAVLVKHFADRQLRVEPGVITFLLRRMERSFAAAAGIAERLDRLALSRGGPITVRLARQALAVPHPLPLDGRGEGSG